MAVIATASDGAVVSSVKVSEALPVLPNVSVWLATIVCCPSPRPVGANDQFPDGSAVVVTPLGVPSIVKCTTALARPVPLSAGFEVIWASAEEPGSEGRCSDTAGP